MPKCRNIRFAYRAMRLERGKTKKAKTGESISKNMLETLRPKEF